jgi:hypothetical protein
MSVAVEDNGNSEFLAALIILIMRQFINIELRMIPPSFSVAESLGRSSGAELLRA